LSEEFAMSKNIGPVDRIIRIILGLVLIAYAIPIWFPVTGWNWVGWIGLIPLATAIFNFCPLYQILGISTSTENK
jgi:hypothetical protein